MVYLFIYGVVITKDNDIGFLTFSLYKGGLFVCVCVFFFWRLMNRWFLAVDGSYLFLKIAVNGSLSNFHVTSNR